MAPEAISLTAGDPLLTLSLKTKPEFTGNKTIAITLAADPLNELADAMYEVIGDAAIAIETVSSSALDIIEHQNADAIGLFCYPNPADDYVLFSYSIAYTGKVTLDLNNMLGYKIATIVSETSDAGDHFLKYETTALPSGVYTATLKFETENNRSVKTIKLIIR